MHSILWQQMGEHGQHGSSWVERLVMGWVRRFFVVRIIGSICLPDEHAREEALVGKRVDVELVPTTAQRGCHHNQRAC